MHTPHLSVVTVWEIQIKMRIGKLTLTAPIDQVVEAHQEKHGVKLMPIDLAHVLMLDKLPMVHKDPFDRMLIAQATVEGLILVTRDEWLRQYPIETVR